MKKEKFVYENSTVKRELLVGQKVQCIYYGEYPDKPNEYHQSFIRKLLDKPFMPVKLGIIVGDAGIRPYWLAGGDGTQQYIYVRFREYRFKKAIPISCIQDAKEAGVSSLRFLTDNEHELGKPGYDLRSYHALKDQANKAIEFSQNTM